MLNWVTIIVGIVALYIGYKLNQYANKQSEERIVAKITAVIEALKNANFTPEQQMRFKNSAWDIIQNRK